MAFPGRVQVTRLAVILAAAGCVETGTVSGKPPERLTREMPHSDPGLAKPTRSDLYRTRQNQSDKADDRVETTDPSVMRIGVASTHVFHCATCALLKDVPVAEQVRFTSKWDGLDAGYRPCDECHAVR